MLYFRMLLLLLISLYTSRVILRELGVDDYGIYTIVGGVVAMFSLISGSMSSAISRFITVELGKGDKNKLKVVFSSSVTIQLIFAAIIIIVGETLGLWFLNAKMVIPSERLTAANWCYQLSLVTFIINIISIPYNAVIISHEKMSAFAYISIVEAISKLAIAFLIAFNPFDKLIYYAMLMAVVAVMVRLLYGWYCNRYFEEAKFSFSFDKKVISSMFGFAGWNMVGSGALVLRNQGVDVLLNMFFGVTVNAAKGICNQIQNAAYQFVTNFQTAINPQLTIAVSQRNYDRNHTLVIQGSRFSFYLLSLFSIPFLIETEYILTLWLGQVPDYTVDFVRWTFIYLQLDCVSRFLINSVLAYGKIRNYQLLVGGTKLLVLPIAWVVLELGGSPVTGVIINCIIEVACLALRLFYNKSYTSLSIIDFLKEVVIHCWAVYLIIWIIITLIKTYFNPHSLVVVALCLIVTILGVWFLGLNREERMMLLSKAKGIITQNK